MLEPNPDSPVIAIFARLHQGQEHSEPMTLNSELEADRDYARWQARGADTRAGKCKEYEV